jgi:flagellar motor switch protein FliM
MTEVLSQNEIDSLLEALSSGEMDAEELKKEEVEKKVRVYDFKRALRFSKDQIRSLTRIHDNYARMLTTLFSAQLRMFVQINVVSVDQLPYEEFIRSISKLTILYIYETEPLEGRMVMEVNPNIAYAMLDRLLGGVGSSPDKAASLTEIESIILERIFNKALERMSDAWKNVIDLYPSLQLTELNPQFMQIVSSNETVVVISMSIKIGETTGMINLCLPHVVLEPIMPKLSAHHWFASQQKTRAPEEKQALELRVNKIKVPVIAELGTSNISVREFLNLSVGDVVQLDRDANSELKIRVGEKQKFTGLPGLVRGRVAVQISKVLREGEEEVDE